MIIAVAYENMVSILTHFSLFFRDNKKITKLDSTAVGGCVSFSLCGERKRESKDKPISAEDELAYTEATCFAIAVTIECYNYIFVCFVLLV